MEERMEINVREIYGETAKLDQIEAYVKKACDLAGEGKDVVLTGPGPVWLYLRIAHALHGKVRSLRYSSPVTGEVVIFDHNPY